MATTTIDLSSLDGNNGFRLDGETSRSVSSAGDINGDGFDDVIVGNPFADANGENSGSSYVVLGKASGFDATLNVSSLNGSNGFRLDGISGYDNLGNSVSNAGDVNGDGFDDLIVGAPNLLDENRPGSSYVVFGKASGFDASIDLSTLDGSNGFRLDGEIGGIGGSESGRSVSNAGDINGDGFDDLIIGAPFAGPFPYNGGVSHVVFGKSSGFDPTLNLSSLDGSNGFRLNGSMSGEFSGWSVSDAGDVNGDGFDDLIVGSRGILRFSDYTGTSYVVFGKASGFDATFDITSLNGNNGFLLAREALSASGESVSGAGDVNGDGFDDVIVGASGAASSYIVFGKASGFDATLDLSTLDGNNGFRLNGGTEGDGSGQSVSNAGDVNGDGFDDVIISASGVGIGYVVFGKTSGFDASIDLANLESTDGFRLGGTNDLSGRAVSNAGDINSDGFDDLIVGAYDSSYVIFGRSDFSSGNVIEGTPGDDILRGTLGADIFEALDGNDTLIGRGGADEFHGDAGNDHIKVADLSFGSVDGGTGNDVLHTDGKDLNLDLSFLGEKIQGIETICLYGRGDNTLTLTAEDLINLSDTSNTLKVHGNAGDRVILDDKWVDRGSHGFYHTYTQDDAVLLVGQNMAAEFA